MSAPTLPGGAKSWSTPERRTKRGISWGAGPWDDEPDKVSWTDAATGRPCLVVRGPSGALCGYVAVDPGHPWHGVDYGCCPGDQGSCDDDTWCSHAPDQRVEVHGGLTYAAPCAETNDESTGICHVPEPGAPDNVWWFGFDCNHLYDLAPESAAWKREHGSFADHSGDVYRPLGYVVRQCESLAQQIASVTA